MSPQSRLERSEAPRESTRNILLVRPSALGDVCRSVPVLASLGRAFPSARIDWLVQPEFMASKNLLLLYFLSGIAALTAGSIFLMWLGEQIDKYGIGNGVSVILTAGILAQFPDRLSDAQKVPPPT